MLSRAFDKRLYPMSAGVELSGSGFLTSIRPLRDKLIIPCVTSLPAMNQTLSMALGQNVQVQASFGCKISPSQGAGSPCSATIP